MSKERHVIINADDFGLSAGVTEGILRAHREGIVTSTTILANMPAAEDAVRRLAEAPELGVGVHLNVSQGPVLSAQGEALADEDGIMRRKPLELIRATLRRGILTAIESEFDAQIRWVLDHHIRPTHLDSHRHLHAFCPIFARVVKLAKRYHIPFVRWPCERLRGSGWAAVGRRQRWVRRWLNGFSRIDRAIGAELFGTRGTWGIAHTGRIDVEWLIRAARYAPPGVIEIMTHPGFAEELDPQMTRLRQSRRTETEALCDPAVRQAFRQQQIRLIHYGHLR